MTYRMDRRPLAAILNADLTATGETQTAFAARVGLTQGEVSRFLHGDRGLSPRIAAGLIRAYPDLRGRIVGELLGKGQPDQDSVELASGLAATG